MFYEVFQEKQSITLGILKGFPEEKPENTNKTVFSGKDKIALQGAANPQKAAWE